MTDNDALHLAVMDAARALRADDTISSLGPGARRMGLVRAKVTVVASEYGVDADKLMRTLADMMGR